MRTSQPLLPPAASKWGTGKVPCSTGSHLRNHRGGFSAQDGGSGDLRGVDKKNPCYGPSLKLTASSPLKNSGLQGYFPIGKGNFFSGAMLNWNFGGGKYGWSLGCSLHKSWLPTMILLMDKILHRLVCNKTLYIMGFQLPFPQLVNAGFLNHQQYMHHFTHFS